VWHKRRWRCAESSCTRRSFTEAIKEIPARARTTGRLRRAIASAVGALLRWSFARSRDTDQMTRSRSGVSAAPVGYRFPAPRRPGRRGRNAGTSAPRPRSPHAGTGSRPEQTSQTSTLTTPPVSLAPSLDQPTQQCHSGEFRRATATPHPSRDRARTPPRRRHLGTPTRPTGIHPASPPVHPVAAALAGFALPSCSSVTR
jgi:hypothetical protein